MTEWKRRTRVVSFRVSEEEHRELTSYCTREGVRSLSDFARLATFIQFEARTISQPDTALQQIYRRLAALDREVQRLSRLLDAPEGEDARTRSAAAGPGGGVLGEGQAVQSYGAKEEFNAA